MKTIEFATCAGGNRACRENTFDVSREKKDFEVDFLVCVILLSLSLSLYLYLHTHINRTLYTLSILSVFFKLFFSLILVKTLFFYKINKTWKSIVRFFFHKMETEMIENCLFQQKASQTSGISD